MKTIDHTGQRFGTQTVLHQHGFDIHRQALWLVACDCGSAPRPVQGSKLRRGESTSCGCAKGAKCAEANIKHGDSARGRMTPEYRAWSNMIDRCEREGNKQFKDWGGRGIKVCARWRHDFAAFLADMGRKPTPQHTIDRIDNDGDYLPGNCRWATRAEQGANKRTTMRLTFRGETRTLREWSRRTGISYATLYARARKGLAADQILTAPAGAVLPTVRGA